MVLDLPTMQVFLNMSCAIRDVLENAKELRLMLCREKRSGTRVGTSVIAACGEAPPMSRMSLQVLKNLRMVDIIIVT